ALFARPRGLAGPRRWVASCSIAAAESAAARRCRRSQHHVPGEPAAPPQRLPVHVGLDLIFLVPREMSGLETDARELTTALLQERPELRITAFVNREAAEDGTWGEVVPTVTVPVYGRRRADWVRGEQLLLPRRAE